MNYPEGIQETESRSSQNADITIGEYGKKSLTPFIMDDVRVIVMKLT
jgi:hypothetical protein